MNEKGDLTHAEIVGKVPNATDIDNILFNELMNIINGDLAITHYIAQSVKRSGLEIWRKLNRQNGPNTHGTKETLKRQIERLASNRTKDTKELPKDLKNLKQHLTNTKL